MYEGSTLKDIKTESRLQAITLKDLEVTKNQSSNAKNRIYEMLKFLT